MKTLSELKEELRRANEGLAQMQEPDAGYFEDFNNKQPHEIRKLDYDVEQQCIAIDRIERQIAKATQ